ncbi:MAG: hypothetical protein ACRDV3_13670, partial [Acidothermaceae bacterium]
MSVTPFDDYVASLGRLTIHVDPTASTPAAAAIKAAVASLGDLPSIDVRSIVEWVQANPAAVPVLGLAVGLSQEKLRNTLMHAFATAGWSHLAKQRPHELIAMFDRDFDLIRLLVVQLNRSYEFGDVLVARAGTKVTASSAGASGRRVEDDIEAIARDLGIPYVLRTRFSGRNGRTAPCDLAMPTKDEAQIVVAAKGFDSTGSKLTDAVREIEEMADVRLPRQFVMAVIDGIGWKSRISDLRRIHQLWERRQIDGMYTLA